VWLFVTFFARKGDWHALCFAYFSSTEHHSEAGDKVCETHPKLSTRHSNEGKETGDIAMNILNALKNDENGFVVSAELVLVGTILVLGMIVGLTELSFNVNQELEDLGSGIGAINQTYYYTLACGKKGEAVGSTYLDFQDEFDNSCDITCNSSGRSEQGGY
jgi:hypothetical protein